MKSILIAAAAALVLAGSADAEPAFDPRGFRADVQGPPTRVFVLGTPHLFGAGDGFDPANLEPLLQRLAAFRPDVIAIENLSGESLFTLSAYKEIYPAVAEDYGRRTLRLAGLAGSELKLDLPQAEAEVRRTLAAWPATPTAAQRRRLAALLAASGDPNSALVQWWRLPQSERRAGDGVSTELAEGLEDHARRRNESHLIAARLAARLGLERVHPTDDQATVDLMLSLPESVAEALGSDPDLTAMRNSPEVARLAGAAGRLTSPEATLATYREVNSDAVGLLDARLQWQTYLKARLPDGLGRRRVAEWEARNLRMVAHIREAMGDRPGKRVLVIVGSAHKPYFDRYLDLMSDVEVVHADEVLK